MTTVQEYKCPCCGGAINFDAKLQKIKCPYCDTEFPLETLASYDEVLKSETGDHTEWGNKAGQHWEEGEQDGLNSYICNSCGGEIVGDANMAASSCPWCGNPVVISSKLAGDLKPDYVIPFKLDKNDAKKALSHYYKGKRLLPKIFKDQNHLDEIKGVYVPFWLFDAESDVNVRFRGTRTRSWRDSHYMYTKTSFYSVIRGGKVSFEHVPVDGSSKMPDDLMESIEPYDFSQAVDFQTAYLAGYFADKYDVNEETCIPRANQRMKNSAVEAFRSTAQKYETLTPESTRIQIQNGTAKYALYPVWMLNTTWKGQRYTFAMNGQTGKLVGNLPMDKKLFAGWFFGVAAAVTALSFLICWLISLF